MQFTERSYAANVFRPKPQFFSDPETGLFVVVTAWGEFTEFKKVFDQLNSFLKMTSEPDATSMGPFIEGLSSDTNRLRAALSMLNENIYKNENSASYQVGLEVFAAVITENSSTSGLAGSLSWAQVGQPHVFLCRNQEIEPLIYQPDWGQQLGTSVPLLDQALGLEPLVHISCGSLRIRDLEQIILVSRTKVPKDFYQQPRIHIDESSRLFVKDNSEMPFWLGIMDFNQ